MPKKKPGMSPAEQSRSFNEAVERMVAAGELDLTEADARLAQLVQTSKKTLGEEAVAPSPATR